MLQNRLEHEFSLQNIIVNEFTKQTNPDQVATLFRQTNENPNFSKNSENDNSMNQTFVQHEKSVERDTIDNKLFKL